jgi:hypothetical protein
MRDLLSDWIEFRKWEVKVNLGAKVLGCVVWGLSMAGVFAWLIWLSKIEW